MGLCFAVFPTPTFFRLSAPQVSPIRIDKLLIAAAYLSWHIRVWTKQIIPEPGENALPGKLGLGEELRKPSPFT